MQHTAFAFETNLILPLKQAWLLTLMIPGDSAMTTVMHCTVVSISPAFESANSNAEGLPAPSTDPTFPLRAASGQCSDQVQENICAGTYRVSTQALGLDSFILLGN